MLRGILVAAIATFAIAVVVAEQPAMAAAGGQSGRVTGLVQDPPDPVGAVKNMRARRGTERAGYGPSVQLRRLANPRLPAGGASIPVWLRVR